jgi:hypothetical protein
MERKKVMKKQRRGRQKDLPMLAFFYLTGSGFKLRNLRFFSGGCADMGVSLDIPLFEFLNWRMSGTQGTCADRVLRQGNQVKK